MTDFTNRIETITPTMKHDFSAHFTTQDKSDAWLAQTYNMVVETIGRRNCRGIQL